MLEHTPIFTILSIIAAVTSSVFFLLNARRTTSSNDAEFLNLRSGQEMEFNKNIIYEIDDNGAIANQELVEEYFSSQRNFNNISDKEQKLITKAQYYHALDELRDSKEAGDFHKSFELFAERLREKNAEELDLSTNEIKRMSLEEIRERKMKRRA